MNDVIPAAWPDDGSVWQNWPATHAYGLWSCTDSLTTVGMLAGGGFDYLAIDLQHGMLAPADLRNASRFLRSTPTTCVVRVAWNRPELIMQALDFGAELVIVPMVDTTDAAAQAVKSVRFPDAGAPTGARSWGPLWPDTTQLPAEANSSVGCIVMIETKLAVQNVAEIAATPGLSGIYVGPNDLALGLGYGRATYAEEPALHNVLERIAAACQANGIIAGLHCSTPEMAKYWSDRAFTMLTVGTDTSLFAAATHDLLQNVRGTELPPRARGY